jgi:hypothetical protein
MLVSYKRVENFVAQQNRLGNDVRWDGWDLVFFYPSQRAVYVPFNQKDEYVLTGAERHNGQWGLTTRVSIDATGNWRVPGKIVRHSQHSRARRR